MTEQEAIKVLEEKGQHIEMIKIDGKDTLCYRAILVEAFEVAQKALEEVQAYRSIGTVDEFKALKEKDTPKNPIRYDKHYYKCPVCNNELGDDDSFYVYDMPKPTFCSKCGNKINGE